jgi:hypothetical protein
METKIENVPAISGTAMSVARDLRDQANVLQTAKKTIMLKEGVHYGVIPGCGNKPAMFKVGSEQLLEQFGLSIDVDEIKETREPDSIDYRVTIRIFDESDGRRVIGVGAITSDEEKYRWGFARKEEYDSTPEDRRRIKYDREGKPILQVRAHHKIHMNTLLKMAIKRATVDGVLRYTAASDIFSQDYDEWDDEMIINLIAKDRDQSTKPAPIKNSYKAPPAKNYEHNNVPKKMLNADSAKAALNELGLACEIKGDFIAARDNDKVRAYDKRESLKSLGFRYKTDTKTWYVGITPAANADNKAA